MSNAIVLSSSEDEIESIPSKITKIDNSKASDFDLSLSDLPKGNFNDIFKGITDISHDLSPGRASATNLLDTDCILSDVPDVHPTEKKNGALDPINKNSKKTLSRSGSQSDSDYETEKNFDDNWAQYMTELKTKHNIAIDLSSDEDNKLEEQEKKKGATKKTSAKSKAEAAEERKRKQEERQQEKLRKQEERQREKLKKQEEADRQKALKQLNQRNRMQYNNENIYKSMEIIIDTEIEKYDFFNDFKSEVSTNGHELNFKLQSQVIPKSITWTRKVDENYINEQHEVCSNTKIIQEEQMLIIWDSEETVTHISNDTFISEISNFKKIVPDKRITLVIYQIESYFKYMKSVKDRAVRVEILGSQGKKKTKSKTDRKFENFPKISRKKFDELLVDIQLLHKVNSRLIEVPCEMVLIIQQYTKSLAMRPSKLEKRKETCQGDWYITSDCRDTVRVDKDGNGLKRLWQQQLCQFPLMSLETAEAIVSVYKSPLQLMEAYANCSPAEGEALLKDIPIRRAAGPLTSSRKIGRELSKKVFIMFTAEDGDLYLN